MSEAVAAFATKRARRAEVTRVNCMLKKKEVLWALLRPIAK